MRRPRGRYNHIGIHSALHSLVKRNGFPVKAAGQQSGPLDMAVGHINPADPAGLQMLYRQLSHLPGTEDQGVLPFQTAQFLTRQFDRRIAYRNRIILNARLRPHPLPRGNRPMEHRIEHRTRRAGFPPHRVSFLYLRENLSFAQHQRIQTGCDIE